MHDWRTAFTIAGDGFAIAEFVGMCPVCGWWVGFKQNATDFSVGDSIDRRVAGASLKELDLSDISTPLAEVKQFLAARYEKRMELDATLFEQVVADVFRGLGYEADAVANPGTEESTLFFVRRWRPLECR